MIKLYGPRLPRKLTLACSGGVDSMAAFDFLRRRHDVSLIHVDHREGNSNEARKLVERVAEETGTPLEVIDVVGTRPKGASLEAWWRDARYDAFSKIDGPVLTVHHLDDCVETWVWSSMHGNPMVIPYRRGNVVRPFLKTPKSELVRWAKMKKIPWVDDASNLDTGLTRNYIRKIAMPHVLKINAGIHKTITKKLTAREADEE